ncbi:MAG: SPOR domain-containing protein [Nitrosomonadales bacterium]|nr:SPOR domain-containing protein [Nitrosomonadales bacterium]
MSKNSSSRSTTPRKGNPLLTGILAGMVTGLLIAGGMAWYILKTPSPFVNNVPHETVKLAPDPVKPPPVKAAPEVAAAASAPAAAMASDKPRFEFYKVLTDKPDSAAPAARNDKTAAENKSSAKETYYLQAGAFTDADDADKLKARLAMLGMEASVQNATLPDKTVWHRVRLGPYKSVDEMNRALSMLKQNGVNGTPMRAQ